MRADIHDGPEHTLQAEAGYIDARPLSCRDRRKPLATRGRTIHRGHERRFRPVRRMSAYLLTAAERTYVKFTEAGDEPLA
jgi:hypothetical protein